MQTTVNIRATKAAREIAQQKAEQANKKRKKLKKEPISQCQLISLAIELLDIESAVAL